MSASEQSAAKALYDLIETGAAMTADETFGMQLALPEGAPSEAFEAIYSTGITCRVEPGRDAVPFGDGTPRRVAICTTISFMVSEAFDRRWIDLSARLAPAGAA